MVVRRREHDWVQELNSQKSFGANLHREMEFSRERHAAKHWFCALLLLGVAMLLPIEAWRTHDRVERKLVGSVCSLVAGVGLIQWLRRPRSAHLHDACIACFREAGKNDTFMAVCDCGWTRTTCESAEAARQESGTHTPNVSEDLVIANL